VFDWKNTQKNKRMSLMINQNVTIWFWGKGFVYLWTKYCISAASKMHCKWLSHCTFTDIFWYYYYFNLGDCCMFMLFRSTELNYVCKICMHVQSRFLQWVTGYCLQLFTCCLLLYDLKTKVFYKNFVNNSITTNLVLYEIRKTTHWNWLNFS